MRNSGSKGQPTAAADMLLSLHRAEAADFLVDRDLSTLAFNRRVLALANQAEVPLLERLRYLCIVSSNLDEFFEVRMALHLRAAQVGATTGPFDLSTFRAISAAAHALIEDQYESYNHKILPELAANSIQVLSHRERNATQQKWVASYFRNEVAPLLLPISLDPAHPFPQVANKSLNFIIDLSKADVDDAQLKVGILRVPRSLPRFIRLPPKVSSGAIAVVSLSSVIRSHLKDLFGLQSIKAFSQFRITRDSDLFVDEEDVQDLKAAMRGRLETRPYGQPVRLEVSSGCTERLALYLRTKFQLPEEALYRVNGPVNLVRLNQIIELAKSPELLFGPFTPSNNAKMPDDETAFALLKQRDVVVHHPYESFDSFLHFLRAAVEDPQVVAIKQTIYRAGNDSVLMDLLQRAVALGKDVTVVLELKARFDEENNIRWAEQLEAAGVQLVYGVVGLKTHAKLMLVTRREGRSLKRYAHLSTGNYNVQTAKLYTDMGFFTADVDITRDVEKLFLYLANPKSTPALSKLVLAPSQLQKTMLGLIDAAAQAARAGKPASIFAKMNSLTDVTLARALIDASTAGVKINLLVRGSCVLQGPPELKSKITVRSIVGRFLEHSRVFHFSYGDQDKLFLSSADWMNRNMSRRVEVAWEITDLKLKRRVIAEALTNYWADNVNAWQLVPNEGYKKVVGTRGKKAYSAQARLMSEVGKLKP
jgi:polyphosphate kinase